MPVWSLTKLTEFQKAIFSKAFDDISTTAVGQGRRSTHISSEQKRRSHINIGFKTLCSLVPALKTQANVRAAVKASGDCSGHIFVSLYLFQFPPACMQITNAVTLQKTVEHIRKLQQERQQLQEEVRKLREEIEELNSSIRWVLFLPLVLYRITSQHHHLSGLPTAAAVSQLVPRTAACYRGSRQTPTLRLHARVQRLREGPHASELEVLDCILWQKGLHL